MKKDERANLRIAPGLHKKIAHYAIDEDVSMAEAVQRAWEVFTALKNQPADIQQNLQNQDKLQLQYNRDDGSLSSARAAKCQKAHDLLDVILLSTDEEAEAAILSNLAVFARLSAAFRAAIERAGTPNAGDGGAGLSGKVADALERASTVADNARRTLEAGKTNKPSNRRGTPKTGSGGGD